MASTKQAVTLDAEQIAHLTKHLAEMRHNVNNSLALIVAACELVRVKPESAPRILPSLSEQPQKVIEEVRRFSHELERLLKLKSDDLHGPTS